MHGALFYISEERNDLSVNKLFYETGHQGGPSSLMISPQTLACVPMKIFVEPHQVPPMAVVSEQRVVGKRGPLAFAVGHEERNHPARELMRDLVEVHPLAAPGGKFHRERVPVEE